MTRNFELSKKEILNWNNHTLHRIYYSDGTKGGWVESYNNIKSDNVRVLDESKVYENAELYDNVSMYGFSEAFEKAKLFDYTKLFDYVRVHGNAEFHDYTTAFDYSNIYGAAKLYGNSSVREYSNIYGLIKLKDYTVIAGNLYIDYDLVLNGFTELKSNLDYYLFLKTWNSINGPKIFMYDKNKKQWNSNTFNCSSKDFVKEGEKIDLQTKLNYKAYVKLVETIEKNKIKCLKPRKYLFF